MTTDRQNIIWDFQRTIIEVYEEYGLTSLRGLHHEYNVNGRQILKWHSEIVRKGEIRYNKSFDFSQNFDDLIFCSDEILYFLAQMYLYRPYLNNPVKDAMPFNGKILYPNYQNLEAKRYSMFANIVSEKLYNFWDRIGDLLATYFPDLIKPGQVYFTKVIDIIPGDYYKNENYQWLKNFKDNQYKDLNSKRRQYVHYTTEDTQFKYNHLNNTTERKQIESLLQNRNDLADFYKQQLDMTFVGFEKTMLLIKSITENTLADVD